MNRRQITIVAIVAGVLAVAACGCWAVQRRAEDKRVTPEWLNPHQPPEGVAAELSALGPAQSWAANRCTPMAASCADRTAGRRTRRTYPGTLADSPDSFIRASVELG